MFYIPECGEPYESLKKTIEEHGGMVIDQHECNSYQIKPENAKLKIRDFYKGQIYGSEWVKDHIQEVETLKNKFEILGNKMLAKKDDYALFENKSDESKKLNISKKKKFTINEGIKLF